MPSLWLATRVALPRLGPPARCSCRSHRIGRPRVRWRLPPGEGGLRPCSGPPSCAPSGENKPGSRDRAAGRVPTSPPRTVGHCRCPCPTTFRRARTGNAHALPACSDQLPGLGVVDEDRAGRPPEHDPLPVRRDVGMADAPGCRLRAGSRLSGCRSQPPACGSPGYPPIIACAMTFPSRLDEAMLSHGVSPSRSGGPTTTLPGVVGSARTVQRKHPPKVLVNRQPDGPMLHRNWTCRDPRTGCCRPLAPGRCRRRGPSDPRRHRQPTVGTDPRPRGRSFSGNPGR